MKSFTKLTPRIKRQLAECVAHYGVDHVAAELQVSKHTVNRYLTKATTCKSQDIVARIKAMYKDIGKQDTSKKQAAVRRIQALKVLERIELKLDVLLKELGVEVSCDT